MSRKNDFCRKIEFPESKPLLLEFSVNKNILWKLSENYCNFCKLSIQLETRKRYTDYEFHNTGWDIRKGG